jgi:hypothetical protein
MAVEHAMKQKADDITGRPNTYILPDIDALLFAIYETHGPRSD